MSNFHFEVQVISRGKGRSVTKLVNYISGKRLHDPYRGETYYKRRSDILYYNIFQPSSAPPEFYDLQYLCNAIEGAERRYDARTAREFKASLPNELSKQELIGIVSEFINENFLDKKLCAIVAIHEGRNIQDPSRNNPHVHIIVPTRTVGLGGFSKRKDREHNKRKYIDIWREQWALIQNLAYERNGLNIRVSHESLFVQGCYGREPVNQLSLVDWQKEQRGERTVAGALRRELTARNKARELQFQLEQAHTLILNR